jgi:WD40 repeat protein
MSVSAQSTGPNSPTGDGLEPGTRIRYFGDYELLKVLGEGGMGIVYKARQLSLNRPVALKMIKATRFASAEDVRRFKNEAEAVALLDHSNIVPIFEVGQYEDQHYFSMKLISGESLDQRLKDYTTDFKGAARLVASAAGAILHAHQRGILHRDLKPANILLDTDGQPHITDFGLAKRVEGDSELTRSGAILGTPAYMAPEQASGRRGSVTTSTDLYGLGAILYALLTGRAPFGGATVLDTLEQVRGRLPESPQKLNPKVPRDLEVVCLKCLEKDPRRRYASADALADDLRRWVEGEPIAARQVWTTVRAWMWCRRNPVGATAAGLAAISLILTAAVSVLYAERQASRAETAEAKYQQAVREAIYGEIGGENSLQASEPSENSPEALQRRLAMLSLERGQAICKQGQIGLGLLWFAESLRAATDARNPVWKIVAGANLSAWERFHPRLTGVFDNRVEITEVALSPDAKRVLTGSHDRGAQLWDAVTGLPIGKPMKLQGRVEAMEFSPDGKIIVTGCADGSAQLWDAASGEKIGNPMEHQKGVFAVGFSPNGKTVVTGSRDGKARLWDATSSLPVGRPIKHPGEDANLRAVASSPISKTIVTGSSDGKARLWDAFTGLPIGEPMEHQGAVEAVAFCPDGKAVFTGSCDGKARLWESATGRPIGHPMDHQGSISTVTCSADGEMIVTVTMDNSRHSYGDTIRRNGDEEGRFVSWDEHEASVWLWDAASRRLLAKPFEHLVGVQKVAIGRDGKSVLVRNHDGIARLWHAAPGRQAGIPLRHDGLVDAVAFSPDGKIVVTGNHGGTARLCDAKTGSPIGSVMVHPGKVTSVAFSPDGRTIFTVSGIGRLWDATTGRPVGKPMAHEQRVDAAAFSPDGKAVLTVGDDTARRWDARTGQLVGKPITLQGGVIAIALRPGGKFLVTGSSDNTARLWDTVTGLSIGKPMKHRDSVEAVAFSPDGHKVVTGSRDRTARLWDFASNRQIGKSMRHHGDVTSVAFSPDGKTVVTGSRDGTARLWDSATGEPIGPPLQHAPRFLTVGEQSNAHPAFDKSRDKLSHDGNLMSVAFSPDGKHVLTAGTETEKARLWEIPAKLPDHPKRLAAWVQTLTGLEFDAQGEARILDSVEWSKCRDLLRRLGGAPLAGSAPKSRSDSLNQP